MSTIPILGPATAWASRLRWTAEQDRVRQAVKQWDNVTLKACDAEEVAGVIAGHAVLVLACLEYLYCVSRKYNDQSIKDFVDEINRLNTPPTPSNEN